MKRKGGKVRNWLGEEDGGSICNSWGEKGRGLWVLFCSKEVGYLREKGGKSCGDY